MQIKYCFKISGDFFEAFKTLLLYQIYLLTKSSLQNFFTVLFNVNQIITWLLKNTKQSSIVPWNEIHSPSNEIVCEINVELNLWDG